MEAPVVDNEKEWEVKEVLQKREKPDGTMEYLIKWEGWSELYNSWKPEGNLSAELVAQYNEQSGRDLRSRKRRKVSSEDKVKEERDDNGGGKGKMRDNGDDKDLDPEKIIDAYANGGHRMFLVKLQGIEKPALFSASVLNVLCPQQVIKFYEDNYEWKPSEKTTPSTEDKSSCVVM